MRILYLGLAVPNMNDYHNMYTDLMVEFKNQGHDVLVVGPAYDNKLVGLQVEDGIKTLRVKTFKLFNVGKIKKGIATLLLPLQYKRALLKSKLELNFDLVIMPTPPITLIDVASWLKRKYNSKVYLILRDIFPQNAVDLGMMKSSSITYSMFRKKERKMYSKSDFIGCMSQGNIDFVKKHNPEIDARKLHLLPNWSRLLPLLGKNEIEQIKFDYKLQNKFIVVFGGNIGRPQKMENVVALAEACSHIADIFFLIIGGGNEKDNLELLIRNKKLNNIRVQGYLSTKEYFRVLQIGQVGLISLSEEFTIPNIPSKSLVYFNAKKPILASIDTNTDFGTNLEDINAGLWAEGGDTETLKAKLVLLYNSREKRELMGNNGYEHLKNYLQTPIAYNTIVKRFSEVE